MNKLNAKQLLLLIVTILLFLAINIYAFILASSEAKDVLGASVARGLDGPIASVVVWSNDFERSKMTDYSINNIIDVKEKNSVTTFPAIAKLYASEPLQALYKDNLLKVNGLTYVEVSDTLDVKLGAGVLNLNAGSKVIIDSTNKRLFLIEGAVSIDGKVLTSQSMISWNANRFEVFKFERNKLNSEKKLRDLTAFLAALELKL